MTAVESKLELAKIAVQVLDADPVKVSDDAGCPILVRCFRGQDGSNGIVSPAEAGSGSVVAFTQDFRPGLILFRPDGLVPARSPALGRVGQIQRQNSVPSPGDSTHFFTPTHR